MQAFRSEGEARRWADANDRSKGAVFAPEQLWRLAQIWYDDRLDLDWVRRTEEERQKLLASCGLTGPFWEIG